jgi:hypothetical protein
MRTAIYVYEPSTVKIRAKDPRDASVEIVRYREPRAQPAVGVHRLDPGIYLIVSNRGLEVAGPNIEVQVVANNKDDWPDPEARVLALEPGASNGTIKEFFAVAMDLSIDS